MRKLRRLFRQRRRASLDRAEQIAGDAARAKRDWRGAHEAYGRHLLVRPGDWPIWVQRGHALKEDGDLPGAERSYRRAADLAPTEAETFLYLTDVLLRLGRSTDAIASARRAWQLGETRVAPMLETLDIAISSDGAKGNAERWVTVEAAARTLVAAQARRDERRWSEAEELYRSYLAIRPRSQQARRELQFVLDALAAADQPAAALDA